MHFENWKLRTTQTTEYIYIYIYIYFFFFLISSFFNTFIFIFLQQNFIAFFFFFWISVWNFSWKSEITEFILFKIVFWFVFFFPEDFVVNFFSPCNWRLVCFWRWRNGPVEADTTVEEFCSVEFIYSLSSLPLS